MGAVKRQGLCPLPAHFKPHRHAVATMQKKPRVTGETVGATFQATEPTNSGTTWFWSS